MQIMGLSSAVGVVNSISGGAAIDVTMVTVAPTAFDAGDGDQELALLLDVVATDAAAAALLARELNLGHETNEQSWIGWIWSPRGSAAPIRCMVRTHDPNLDGAAAGRSAQLATLATAVNTIGAGVGIDVATLTASQTACLGRQVHVQAADVISGRVLASDLGLEATPQLGSMTWGGRARPARGADQIELTVSVRPTADFEAAFTNPLSVETGR